MDIKLKYMQTVNESIYNGLGSMLDGAFRKYLEKANISGDTIRNGGIGIGFPFNGYSSITKIISDGCSTGF